MKTNLKKDYPNIAEMLNNKWLKRFEKSNNNFLTILKKSIQRKLEKYFL